MIENFEFLSGVLGFDPYIGGMGQRWRFGGGGGVMNYISIIQ